MPAIAAPLALTDAAALRRRQQSSWACADFSVIGTTLQIVAENLAEAADIRPGEKVVDVAAGTGNAALAAARRYAHAVAIDHVPALLDKGRERARAESLAVSFRVADAEALPIADRSIDAVLSTFGVMHALDPARAASELRRVLLPGGRIALASWALDGFVGRLLALIARHVPARAACAVPACWSEPAALAALLGVAPTRMRHRRLAFRLRYRSAAHAVQVLRDFHGPIHKAFAALDAPGQAALEHALVALLEAENTAGPGALVVPAEYLEAVIVPDGPLTLPQ